MNSHCINVPWVPFTARDRPVRLQEVAHDELHAASVDAVRHVELRSGGHDLTEVRDPRARGEHRDRARPHRVLDDVRAGGHEVHERCDGIRAHDRGLLPLCVVEAGPIPPVGLEPLVDPLDEVAFFVSRWTGRPGPRVDPPGSTGRDHLTRTVGVLDADPRDQPRHRRGTALPGGGPVGDDADRVARPRATADGDVHRLGILLVRIRERRAVRNARAVDAQLELLAGRDVHRAPARSDCGRGASRSAPA